MSRSRGGRGRGVSRGRDALVLFCCRGAQEQQGKGGQQGRLRNCICDLGKPLGTESRVPGRILDRCRQIDPLSHLPNLSANQSELTVRTKKTVGKGKNQPLRKNMILFILHGKKFFFL